MPPASKTTFLSLFAAESDAPLPSGDAAISAALDAYGAKYSKATSKKAKDLREELLAGLFVASPESRGCCIWWQNRNFPLKDENFPQMSKSFRKPARARKRHFSDSNIPAGRYITRCHDQGGPCASFFASNIIARFTC